MASTDCGRERVSTIGRATDAIVGGHDTRIRKQVHELTLEDLRAFPAWEYALDEEDVDGQDEATVRPCAVEHTVDASAHTILVRARFVLADGSECTGFLTLPRFGDDSLGALQPVVVTPTGQVLFWHGARAPKPDELAAAYRSLGQTGAARVFPMQFSSDVPLTCGEIRGQIDGFLVLEDWRTVRTRVVH